MMLLAVLIGTLLSATIGWLVIRLIEGKHSIFGAVERCAAAMILGPVVSMLIIFLISVADIVPLTRWSVFLIQITLCGMLYGLLHVRKTPIHTPSNNVYAQCRDKPGHLYHKIVFCILGLWTIVKIISMAIPLLTNPPYHDDVINNWSFRAKTFHYEQQFTLELQKGFGVVENNRVSSYPPSIPLYKASLTLLYGEWNDTLANAPHLIWLLAGIVLLYYSLRRRLNILWSLIGCYILTSIPLYVVHVSAAYADILLSVYIFIAMSMLLHALWERDTEKQRSYLLISALAMGLITFVKNEGVALYFPLLALAGLLAGTALLKQRKIERRTLVQCVSMALMILVPWLLFKWFHGLPFGNAKEASGLELTFEPLAFQAILVMNFLEGNWNIFIPLFIILILLGWKNIRGTPLQLLTGFLVITMLLQICLFTFTSLATEAIRQTGYGRGMIHLIPCMVFLVTILLQQISEVLKRTDQPTYHQ